MAQLEPIQPVTLGQIWNPMQALGPIVSMRNEAETIRHHQVQEAYLAAEEQRKVQAHQLDIKLKGAETLMKSGLGPVQLLDVTNSIAETLGIPKRYTVSDLGAPVLALQNYITALRESQNNPAAPDVLKAFDTILHTDPALARKVQQAQGIQQMSARSQAQPFSLEEALSTTEGGATELTKGAVEGPKLQAQVAALRAKTELDQQGLENKKAELGSIIGRTALYDAQRAEVAARGTELKRKGQVTEAFMNSIPQLQAQVQQNIGSLSTDIASMKQSLLTEHDPSKSQRLESELAWKNLNLSARLAESRWLENPTPELYKVYEQAQNQVNESLKRQSLAINKQQTALDNLEFKQNEAKIKHERETASAKGQRAFAALPETQQNSRSAAKIAAQIEQETGQAIGTQEIMKGIENPNKPMVEVNTGTKASEVAAGEFMKSTRESYDKLKTAPVLLRNIEKAQALIPEAKSFMGPGGETLLEATKFLNNRLGTNIDVKGIKSAEELRTRIFGNIMENLKKMDAQPSQLQQQIMMDALGKLGTDPNALSNVLEAYADTIREKVDLHNAEVESGEKRGVTFPYNPRITIPEKKRPTNEEEAAAITQGELTKEEQARLQYLRKKYGR